MKKIYKAVCLLNEEVVSRRTFAAKDEEDAVQVIQDNMPNMRSESARIYLNGLTAPRHVMGQKQYETA